MPVRGGGTHACHSVNGDVRGQLLEVSSLLSHGSQAWNAAHQVEGPFPAEPSYLPLNYFLIVVCSETFYCSQSSVTATFKDRTLCGLETHSLRTRGQKDQGNINMNDTSYSCCSMHTASLPG